MEAVVKHIACDIIALVPNREEDEPGWSANRQDGNKRRSANQKGRRDGGTGTDNCSKSAGDRGKKLFLCLNRGGYCFYHLL